MPECVLRHFSESRFSSTLRERLNVCLSQITEDLPSQQVENLASHPASQCPTVELMTQNICILEIFFLHQQHHHPDNSSAVIYK
ncbi:hypothetical protein AVEN_146412-1 [Araneus ventricosus]|uniref:Uncharacterized protein n=1 Tax=Araneus ventricosus TaxID=182803 RepID=A0A4Y2M2N6_ARAVE|nr:hypothetical protein AVEN_146412-1 [Araneus ventricosus]